MLQTLRGRGLSPPVAVLGGVAALLVLAAAAQRVGADRLVLVVVAGACAVVLVARPALAVAVVILVVVGLESDPQSFLHGPTQLYGYLPGPKITGLEALLVLALVSVVVHAVSRGSLWLPHPFTLPLLLVVMAFVAGGITGSAAGSSTSEIIDAARTALPLAVVPLLIVNVVATRRDLLRWVAFVAALAAFKAVIGVFMVVTGNGLAIDDDGTRGTYLESTSNLLAVMFLGGVVAAWLGHARIPRWISWCAPIVVAALVLSFRRSFWIAAVVVLLLVLVFASGRVGRRMLVPSAVVVGLLGWALVSTGIGGGVDGRVIQRAESLAPAKVQRNEQDRYRISERHNVWAELRDSPIAGLGLGQGWTATQPLPLEHPGGRQYVHFAALWWWMRGGVLGLAAYVGLILSVIVVAAGVARRYPDARIRAAALGAAAGTVGLALAELTATFTGSEVRATVVVGMIVGLLAVASQLGPRAAAPPGAEGPTARR